MDHREAVSYVVNEWHEKQGISDENANVILSLGSEKQCLQGAGLILRGVQGDMCGIVGRAHPVLRVMSKDCADERGVAPRTEYVRDKLYEL